MPDAEAWRDPHGPPKETHRTISGSRGGRTVALALLGRGARDDPSVVTYTPYLARSCSAWPGSRRLPRGTRSRRPWRVGRCSGAGRGRGRPGRGEWCGDRGGRRRSRSRGRGGWSRHAALGCGERGRVGGGPTLRAVGGVRRPGLAGGPAPGRACGHGRRLLAGVGAEAALAARVVRHGRGIELASRARSWRLRSRSMLRFACAFGRPGPGGDGGRHVGTPALAVLAVAGEATTADVEVGGSLLLPAGGASLSPPGSADLVRSGCISGSPLGCEAPGTGGAAPGPLQAVPECQRSCQRDARVGGNTAWDGSARTALEAPGQRGLVGPLRTTWDHPYGD
jgi:hypothetical protein